MLGEYKKWYVIDRDSMFPKISALSQISAPLKKSLPPPPSLP